MFLTDVRAGDFIKYTGLGKVCLSDAGKMSVNIASGRLYVICASGYEHFLSDLMYTDFTIPFERAGASTDEHQRKVMDDLAAGKITINDAREKAMKPEFAEVGEEEPKTARQRFSDHDPSLKEGERPFIATPGQHFIVHLEMPDGIFGQEDLFGQAPTYWTPHDLEVFLHYVGRASNPWHYGATPAYIASLDKLFAANLLQRESGRT